MNYKERVISNLKILFSKKGYNITFNKKHPEYKNGTLFNENQSGHNNTIILAVEYVTFTFFVILSIVLCFYLRGNLLVYIPILSIAPLFLVLILNTTKFHEISRKYGDDKGTSFLLELILPLVPLCIMGGIFLGLTENNLLYGIGFIIMTIYPWLLMLCRINVFSDKSIPRYEGPKMSINLGPGYVPIIYWLLSVQIGFAVTKVGFRSLQNSLTLGDPTLLFCLTAIILGIISQSIVVLPDMVDRVVPVDMRMKKGYVLMVILAILLVFISWTVMSII